MNDSDLWDHVHRLYGIGTWSEDEGLPFWKWKALEVHKIRLMRNKRGVSTDDLRKAADYCKAHKIDIRNVSWLYQHLADSGRWWRAREEAAATHVLDREVNDAIAFEVANHPHGAWLDRLVRAQGDHRQEVLQAWRKFRGSQLNPSARSS